MELGGYERHLLGPVHPGVLAAVVVAMPLAWVIGAATTRLILRVRDPLRRLVYLSLPIGIITLFILVLPYVIFEVGWKLVYPPNVVADLYFARFVLAIPLLVALISGIKHFLRSRGAARPRPAV